MFSPLCALYSAQYEFAHSLSYFLPFLMESRYLSQKSFSFYLPSRMFPLPQTLPSSYTPCCLHTNMFPAKSPLVHPLFRHSKSDTRRIPAHTRYSSFYSFPDSEGLSLSLNQMQHRLLLPTQFCLEHSECCHGHCSFRERKCICRHKVY